MENYFILSVIPEVLNRASSQVLGPMDSRSTHCANDSDVVTIFKLLISVPECLAFKHPQDKECHFDNSHLNVIGLHWEEAYYT